jgi:hypothetical protein
MFNPAIDSAFAATHESDLDLSADGQPDCTEYVAPPSHHFIFGHP